jgi:hypothetical protein
MGKVSVEGLTEWESREVISQGAVYRGIGGYDELVLKTGEQLLDIAETLGASCWITIGVVEIVCAVLGSFGRAC